MTWTLHIGGRPQTSGYCTQNVENGNGGGGKSLKDASIERYKIGSKMMAKMVRIRRWNGKSSLEVR